MKFQISTYNSIKKKPKILVIDKQNTWKASTLKLENIAKKN